MMMLNKIFIPYTILIVAAICISVFYTLVPIIDYTWLMFNIQKQYWWTPLTYQYLHLNINHLVFNMGGLLFFGTIVEKHIGSWHTLFLITISSILAGEWWYLLHLTDVVAYMVGMSGAIYSLISVCFLYVLPKKVRMAFYAGLVVLIVLAFLQPMIAVISNGLSAWETHVMGLFLGILYTFYLVRRDTLTPTPL